MTQKLDIKINQSIISILGRKLYSSNFGFVVLRELIQNSLDAGAKEILISWDSTKRILTVFDDGCGIAKIDGLLNVIGESLKNVENLETIGGYGLAKLAIFGCKEFQFQSISGSFSTGFLYDPDNKISSGTMVSCEFLPSDIDYCFEERIENYLKTINRDVVIFYNDTRIEKPVLKSVYFGENTENIAENIGFNGRMIARVNGLMSFSEYIPNLEGSIIVDYSVTANPYDNDYPLTSNRDSFIDGSGEKIDWENRKKAIIEVLEKDKRLKENISKDCQFITWRSKKYLSGGNVTISDYERNASSISAFERYIRQIAEMRQDELESNIVFGLSDGSEEEAFYSPSDNQFCLAKCDYRQYSKGKILSLAIHEYVHYMGYGRRGHDQSFGSQLTILTGEVFESMFAGKFRK